MKDNQDLQYSKEQHAYNIRRPNNKNILIREHLKNNNNNNNNKG